MIDTIYIVNADNDLDYSDHNEWLVVACLSEEQAKATAAKLNGLLEYARTQRTKLYDEFEQPYRASHPQTWLSRSHPIMSEKHMALSLSASLLGNLDEEQNALLGKMQASFEKKVSAYKLWLDTEWKAQQDKWHAAYEAARAAWLKESDPRAEEVVWAKSIDPQFPLATGAYDYYELSVLEEAK